MTVSLKQYLSAFAQAPYLNTLSGIGRGIERETLRVHAHGELSQQPHNKALGSALTHPQITTDYAENLLEFITPVSHDAATSIKQLQDIQKFTLSQLDGELLWPLSMPCFVGDETKIPLAQYGTSNIGKMKTVYRQGLKNRYGSMMQVISGIHFNFSFSHDFWRSVQKISSSLEETTEQKTASVDDLTDFISARYFALLRNYKRYCWLIPYLFGSSPLICPSFLQDKPQKLPFKKTASGYLYLEYATSLRMSDLGYTSSSQAALRICYDSLENYVAGVKTAINLPSEEFAKLGVKVDGKYQQLNTNVLQIENELYAPIRPKRVIKSGEKPSDALFERGVEYIEVRALDVNPFVDTGISVEQIHFLDVFLTFCALVPNENLDCDSQKVYEKNMDEVVLRGRDPQLQLKDQNSVKSIPQWGNEIFTELAEVAKTLDLAYKTDDYTKAVSRELTKINDPSKTLSAQLLAIAKDNEHSLTEFTLATAKKYRQQILARNYQHYDEDHFIVKAAQSHDDQQAIENADTMNFDDFLFHYFKK
ncbi:MAG: glutamate--cysteine ligase [Alteromonadaceae bacterium]|nr:glutamate--cysteine ligase [Alteromonadaceae bacterium]